MVVARDWSTGNRGNDIRKCMGAVFGEEYGRSDGSHGCLQKCILVRRDGDDMYARIRVLDASCCFNTIHARHFHIHNDDLRRESIGHLNGRLSVCGLADNG